MKLQHLSIIFVVIVIPISLIMAQYLQTQIDTITLQSKYQVALDDATHAALTAFQVNTINNKYSSISDSKIRDVEASVNTFYNSLGTSMNLYISSRERLKSFIPAILFNLYDGYYIYSSYENTYETTGRDESKLVQIDEDNRNFQDGLHPYIYYSCKYKLNNGKIVVINYTLDNAITVYGDVGDGNGYQTKSGYLINTSKISNINTGSKTLTYDGVQIGPETLTEHLLILEESDISGLRIVPGDYEYIIYNNQKVYKDTNGEYFWYDNYKKRYLQTEKASLEQYLSSNGVGFKSTSAFDYYYDAYNFTKWLLDETKLKDLKQSDALKMEDGITPVGNDKEYFSIDTGDKKIFDVSTADNDPMLSGSYFNSHRIAIIRKSIETNLLTAITTYQNSLTTYEFTLPVIDEENWYEICNNVSIISFMQGVPIGMKYFNGYSVLSNTKNEEVINEQSLYIVAQKVTSLGFDGELEYHKPGCKELIDSVNRGEVRITGAYTSLSFLRQTVKISEGNLRYFYPQARNGATIAGCYNCIVGATVDYNVDDIITGEIKHYETNAVLYDENDIKEVRKMYLTALARERKDLYKSNFN